MLGEARQLPVAFPQSKSMGKPSRSHKPQAHKQVRWLVPGRGKTKGVGIWGRVEDVQEALCGSGRMSKVPRGSSADELDG